MTESTFPFEAVGDGPETSGTDRRKLALVAGAGALAVAVLGYFVVLPMFSGGSSGPESFVVQHHAPAKTKAKTTAKAPAKKAVPQPASYADVSARQDPFKPLVQEKVEAPAAPAPAAGGTTSGTTSGTTGGTTSGTTTGSSASVGGARVALLHVYTKDGKQYAQTRVGETVYNPLVGATFAGSYKLLATSGTSATYLFGDEQFSLNEGEEVLK
jgi:hypothetical protein